MTHVRGFPHLTGAEFAYWRINTLKLTQRELAELASVNVATISRWERRRLSRIHYNGLMRLYKALYPAENIGAWDGDMSKIGPRGELNGQA